MNKFIYSLLILLPIIILLMGTVSSSTSELVSIQPSSNRTYTQFNITANVNESYVCDVTLTLPKPENKTECSYVCGKYYYRIEEDPQNINKFYFCPTKALACRDNTTVDFKPLSSCWRVTCFSNNRSVKVDATYTVLCVDPNPPASNVTLSSSSNSLRVSLSYQIFVIIAFIFSTWILQ